MRDQIATDSTTTSNNGIPMNNRWIYIVLTTKTVTHVVLSCALTEVSSPRRIQFLDRGKQSPMLPRRW